MDIFLPQPSTVKQNSVYLTGAGADIMLLIFQYQQTEMLQCAVFPIIGVPDRIASIIRDHFSAVIQLIVLRCVYHKLHFVFNFAEYLLSIICFIMSLPVDIINSMPHQFRQCIIIGILTLMICDIPDEGRVF